MFGKVFHLSKSGAKTITQAGIWLALFNLSALLPVIFLSMVSEEKIMKHFGGDNGKIPLLPYIAALLAILAIMFFTDRLSSQVQQNQRKNL